QAGATLPFDEAVPRAVLEKKVQAYLRQSLALEKLWHTPVTADMLRHESERIARSTRMAGRLQELYAALGNDPFVFQETLARSVLVDRLARGFFSSDPLIHAVSRNEIEALHRRLGEGPLDPSLQPRGGTVTELLLDPGDAKEPAERPGGLQAGEAGAHSLRLARG